MSKLRLSLTIPGAVSLGAYEGGALSALILAARTLGEDTIVIDTIAAASAGSITALLAARALLRGCDPTELFSKAWVESASLSNMKTHHPQSPLSSDALKKMGSDLLGPKPKGIDDGPVESWQQQPVTISMALASLSGLTYTLPSLAQRTLVEASSFLDFFTVTLDKDDGPDVYVTNSAAAIASASNAMGFPPAPLDRLKEKDAYDAAGLKGFPADGKFWYTDGGTVDNEPLGRTIELANGVKSDDERVHLLIHPDPGAPSAHMQEVFGGDAPTPSWTRTATHTLSMMRAQTIYDDLRRLEKTNTELDRVRTIGPALKRGLEDGLDHSGLPEAERQRVREAVDTALAQALGEIRTQKATERKAPWAPERRTASASGGDYGDTAQALIEAAAGLEGRDPVRVEIVSPALGAEPGESPSTLLAGSFLFHFGGFFDVDYRKSDFALGFRNMTYWLTNCLGAYLPDVPARELQRALDVVDAAYNELGWDGFRKGGATLESLSVGQKVELGLLGGHVAHVVEHDVVSGGT